MQTVGPQITARSIVRTESQARTGLNKDALARQWPDFVQDVTKNRIAVGTTLSESHLLDLTEGLIRIGCPDDYHLSTLKRHKEFLAETFQRITGSRMSIEPVLQKEPSGSAEHAHVMMEAPTTRQTTSSTVDDKNEHPVIRALTTILGAEKVQ